MRDHLLTVEKSYGKRDSRLDSPVVWDTNSEMYAGMLLDIFFQLSITRPQGFNGPLPVTWTEIQSWCELNEMVLTPFEVQLIKMLDMTYLIQTNKQQE